MCILLQTSLLPEHTLQHLQKEDERTLCEMSYFRLNIEPDRRSHKGAEIGEIESKAPRSIFLSD